MNRTPLVVAHFLVGLLAVACVAQDLERLPPRRARPGATAVGIEYVVLDRTPLVEAQAREFAAIGLTAAKHYPEAVAWGKMQRGPRAPIDFSTLDDFVRSFQATGFGELVLCLKSESGWASRRWGLLARQDPTPRAEHEDAYAAWVGAVVERYDGDGVDDLPGLRWPIRHVEIGSEFSSYEPEPVERYLEVLEIAYRAAHRASADVLVSHAAFMPTLAFAGRPPATEEGIGRAFAARPERIERQHGLADMRAVLDRPDLFDVVNVHALADPYEIDSIADWLEFETSRRGYRKPWIVSDTTPSPFIAWGPATTCQGPLERLGLIVPPAVEADRCRLAEYFARLVGGDAETLGWARRFIAADMVQKAIVAADRKALLIDLAFTIDLPFLTGRAMKAGAGNSAWAGAIRLAGHRVVERRPLYHAAAQLMTHLAGHRAVERVDLGDPAVRVYRIDGDGPAVHVAWLDPGRLVLPGDPVPAREIRWPVAGGLAVERLATDGGRPGREAVDGPLTLTPEPVYVVAAD